MSISNFTDGSLSLGTVSYAATNLRPVVVVPVRTVSESNTREHWAKRAKRAKEQRRLAALFLRQWALILPALGPDGLVVTLIRIAPRALDDDNLRGATKAVRDGVADWLGIDDRDPRVTWEYGQSRGAPKQYAVWVGMRKQ